MAFEAYIGTKVYIDCDAEDIVQWRLSIRQSANIHRRDVLNNLRRLLRVSSTIPNPPSSNCATTSVTFSKYDFSVIENALQHQWAFKMFHFQTMMSELSKEVVDQVVSPCRNDAYISRRIVCIRMTL